MCGNFDPERMAELHGADVAASQRRKQVVGPSLFEAFGELGNVDVREPEPPLFAFQYHAALRYMHFIILLLEPVTDFPARVSRFQVSKVGIQPVSAGVAFPRRQDLDLLAARESLCKRYHNAIDLGAAATVTYFGVNRIGKVERRGASREVYDVTLRREQIDLIVECRLFEALDKVAAPRRLRRGFQEAP